MSPQAASPGTATRSDKSTVAISDRTVKELDALAERAERKTREVLGYAVKPTRGQIVAELVSEAATRRDGEE